MRHYSSHLHSCSLVLILFCCSNNDFPFLIKITMKFSLLIPKAIIVAVILSLTSLVVTKKIDRICGAFKAFGMDCHDSSSNTQLIWKTFVKNFGVTDCNSYCRIGMKKDGRCDESQEYDISTKCPSNYSCTCY